MRDAREGRKAAAGGCKVGVQGRGGRWGREMQLRDVGEQESKGEKERGLSFGVGERAGGVQRG